MSLLIKKRFSVIFKQEEKKILSWFGDDYNLLKNHAIKLIDAEEASTSANIVDNQSGRLIYSIKKGTNICEPTGQVTSNFHNLNSKLGAKIFVALAPVISNKQYDIDEEEMLQFAMDIYHSIEKIHATEYEVDEFIMLSIASIKLQLDRDKSMSTNNLTIQ